MRHRGVRRQTFGKTPVKHASTLVDNTGAGVGSVFVHVIYKTGQVRSASGAVQDISQKDNTESLCKESEIIKYVNICLQCSPRDIEPTNVLDNAGWLEWAVYVNRTLDRDPGVTNLGVATLGVVASHVFRGNCLMTGCFPIGTRQAMSQDLRIKIPKAYNRLQLGDTLKVACYVRTSKSTDMRTDSHRLIVSSHFKSYQ